MAMETSWRAGGKNIQDGISLISAVLLFLSPWAFGYSGEAMAARMAWIFAIVVGIMAVAALVRFAEWEEWVTLVLGLCVIAAPWFFGFAAVTPALATFVVLGVVIALASSSELWMVHHPTAMAK
jgi:hypothetical protein